MTESPERSEGALETLRETFGRIDIYLFDQIMRGRIRASHRILDAGCGAGRNAHYLMRAGADVWGLDSDEESVEAIRRLASSVAPDLPSTNFRTGDLSDLPFGERRFDVVVASAVLHFAPDEPTFERWLSELWRVLKVGGVLFCRMASSIGIEERVRPVDGRVHALPDGSERFLVDEEYLIRLAEVLKGEALDPIKTTNVQNLRAMTTWVLRKS